MSSSSQDTRQTFEHGRVRNFLGHRAQLHLTSGPGCVNLIPMSKSRDFPVAALAGTVGSSVSRQTP